MRSIIQAFVVASIYLNSPRTVLGQGGVGANFESVQGVPSSSQGLQGGNSPNLPFTSRDQTGAAKQLSNIPGGARPKIVMMVCTQGYMPVTAQDLNNLAAADDAAPGTDAAAAAVEVACKPMNDPSGGFCDPSSCQTFPTASNCRRIVYDEGNSTQLAPEVIPSVVCKGNYYIHSPDESDQLSFCADEFMKTYMCSGQCDGAATCTTCVRMDDPAFVSVQQPI
ncbi:hypothetical protein CROQUDRAFT_59233 [Cronartium quercuum f. sp. fusiforme G11]|uniref:Uncharacterized protein n=1 Tax=Cronartium quercuum f. sp. fusiforme G11 TaxID=708437 RepID=A0A9P6NLV1_9BASI|nr:hypothetical protein CROQUDRAFT_59233 [Cronartium quercuum f. sp. fusiforme G11]